jgi:DNA-binding Lrp family transcriptional regulator
MSDEAERQFTGYWIPVEIADNPDLSWSERILWAEIHALSKGAKGCIASNAHFADHLGLSQERISRMISHLREQGLVEDLGFNGRFRRMRATQPCQGSLDKKVKAALTKTSTGKRSVNQENISFGNSSPAQARGRTGEEDHIIRMVAAIYAEYPRKVAKPDALRAIRKALKTEPFNLLLERTKAFAAIWLKAPENRRKFCPYPASWFNAEGYNDSPKDWRRNALDDPKPKRSTMTYFQRNNRINTLNQRKVTLQRQLSDAEEAGKSTSQIEQQLRVIQSELQQL